MFKPVSFSWRVLPGVHSPDPLTFHLPKITPSEKKGGGEMKLTLALIVGRWVRCLGIATSVNPGGKAM